MLENIVKDDKFARLMQKNIEDMIIYLFDSEQNFGILCKIDDAHFEPELPSEIQNSFRDLTLFFLAGYTFDTARIEDDCLIFEAGFGSENIGSVVTVPLLSIMQIIIDETPILINLAAQIKKKKSKSSKSGVENSMASFLSNPENAKFIKK